MFKTEDGKMMSSYYKKDGGFIKIIQHRTVEEINTDGMTIEEIFTKFGTVIPEPIVTISYETRNISRLEYYKGRASEAWEFEGGRELAWSLLELTSKIALVALPLYVGKKLNDKKKGFIPVEVVDDDGNHVDTIYVKVD